MRALLDFKADGQVRLELECGVSGCFDPTEKITGIEIKVEQCHFLAKVSKL